MSPHQEVAVTEMRPAAEIRRLADALEENIREHGWDPAVDAAGRALEWTLGESPLAAGFFTLLMQRPAADRRRDWIGRGGNPDDWPEA